MLVKELWLGNERAYTCKISKRGFAASKYGSGEAARRAALKCVCEIIRDQSKNGVPAGTSIRQRRKLYCNSEANRLHPAVGFAAIRSAERCTI
jgi:hypothetical protein